MLWTLAQPPAPPHPSRLVLVVETDPDAAQRRANEEAFAAVVVDGREPERVSAVLGAAAAGSHDPLRMAVGRYEDLPTLVRDVEAGVVQRVLATPVTGIQLLEAVAEPDPSASLVRRRALAKPDELPVPAVDRQLRELVERFAALPTVVIRPLVARDPVPRVQLVVPVSDPLEDVRRELPAVLGWPLKAAGSAMGRRYRDHPVRRVLGNLGERQEVYCLGRSEVAYVAFFPWADDLKVTVVIGFLPTDPKRVADLHAHAVAAAREFPLPAPHRHSPEVFYDPDYDWVITRSYVGPDRRRKATSFINRYTFRGRRKALMPGEFTSAGTFVDGVPRWAWGAAVGFAVLFLVDTAMTAYYVGGGQVGELNPVMRWALDTSPIVFWALKTSMVLVASFIVLRWHLWRPGRWLFGGSISIYVVLDLYWLALFFGRSLR